MTCATCTTFQVGFVQNVWGGGGWHKACGGGGVCFCTKRRRVCTASEENGVRSGTEQYIPLHSEVLSPWGALAFAAGSLETLQAPKSDETNSSPRNQVQPQLKANKNEVVADWR